MEKRRRLGVGPQATTIFKRPGKQSDTGKHAKFCLAREAGDKERVVSWKPEQRGREVSRREYSIVSNPAKTNRKTTENMHITCIFLKDAFVFNEMGF